MATYKNIREVKAEIVNLEICHPYGLSGAVSEFMKVNKDNVSVDLDGEISIKQRTGWEPLTDSQIVSFLKYFMYERVEVKE